MIFLLYHTYILWKLGIKAKIRQARRGSLYLLAFDNLLNDHIERVRLWEFQQPICQLMVQRVIVQFFISIDYRQDQIRNPTEIALADLLEPGLPCLSRSSVRKFPFAAARGLLQRGEELVLGDFVVAEVNVFVRGEGGVFERGCYGRPDGGEKCGDYGGIAVIIYGCLASFDVETDKCRSQTPSSALVGAIHLDLVGLYPHQSKKPPVIIAVHDSPVSSLLCRYCATSRFALNITGTSSMMAGLEVSDPNSLGMIRLTPALMEASIMLLWV